MIKERLVTTIEFNFLTYNTDVDYSYVSNWETKVVWTYRGQANKVDLSYISKTKLNKIFTYTGSQKEEKL